MDPESSAYDKDLLKQWYYFQSGNPVDRHIVRGIIYDSWLRCREANTNPEKLELERLSYDEFAFIQKRDARLIATASPILELLADASNFDCLYLCSREGIGLYSVYGPEDSNPPVFSSRKERIGEKSIPDGAASMSLRLRQEVEIFGPEHWHMALHGSYCMAKPIFDEKRNLVGVLSTYVRRQKFHPSIRSMIRLAVRFISSEFVRRALLDEITGGVLLLNENGDIQEANSKAKEWLQLPVGERIKNIKEFLDNQSCLTNIASRISFDRKELVLRRGRIKDKNRFSVSFLPVGEHLGLLRLSPQATPGDNDPPAATGVKAAFTFDDIVGTSETKQQTVQLAGRMASMDAPVLILGESGTGKEMFAQSLHNASPRKKKPFVVVNCGALPRDLVQAELFGYEEGAFTGARKKGNMGKFEMADGGTIFLDEIGDMPLEAQASLLRLTQNGEVTRIGGRRGIHVDVRIIAATNRDLPALMKAGAFREDLYFRLCALTLHIPPLRERKEDIRRLVQRFLTEIEIRNHGAPSKIFSESALEKLEKYNWPGNIRQLRNVVEQAYCFASDKIIKSEDIMLPSLNHAYSCEVDLVQDLPDNAQVSRQKAAKESDRKHGDPVEPRLSEREILEEALNRCGGNIKKTAALLNVSRYTLYKKIKACGLSPDEFRGLRLP